MGESMAFILFFSLLGYSFSTRCLIPSIIPLRLKDSFIKNFQKTFDGIPRCYIQTYPFDKAKQKAKKQASSKRGRRVSTDPFIHHEI